MVPDKFNMVDMEGIDIITSQGEAVEGLYQKLVESIAQCRYQCLYNWKFDGILIPPTYVEMDIVDDVVWINEGVSVDEEDVVRVYSLERPGELTTIAISANGDYLPPEGYDGFSSVSVNVPSPVLEAIQITENGSYTPPEGVDGFYSVGVNVPPTEPSIIPITITQNGVITAPSGIDGYSPITVNVQGASTPKLSFHTGKLTINTGVIDATDTTYCYSDLVPIVRGTGRWFLDLTRNSQYTSSYFIGICLYADDGETVLSYIRQYELYRSYDNTSSAAVNAKYCRVAVRVVDLTFANAAHLPSNVHVLGTDTTIKQAEL